MRKLFFIIFVIFTSLIISRSQLSAEDNSNQMLDEILRDVIEYTEKKADEVVSKETKHTYPKTKPEEADHQDANAIAYENLSEIEKQLAQLNEQHEKKLKLLNKELDKTLAKYEKEFRKESGNEDKPKKLKGKRSKLQKKVDQAYAKFKKRVNQENAKYEKKKQQILSRHDNQEENKRGKSEKKSKGKDK